MKRVLVVVSVLVLLAVAVWSASAPAPVSAQDVTPTPGPEASKLLLDAKWFGKGWKRIDYTGVSADATLFREAAFAAYGGPQGSRVVIAGYLVTNSRTAIRQSWDAVGTVFDHYHYLMAYDYNVDSQLQALPAPDGCAEAKRTEGTDTYYGGPVAVTLCAADPDKIVLAIVLGGVNGITDHTISDWVATMAVTGKQLPVPVVPTPQA